MRKRFRAESVPPPGPRHNPQYRLLMEADARLVRFRRASSGRHSMPAKSAAQQKAAGAALSAKRGDTPKSKLKGASKSMASSMSEKELKKMASTSRKGKSEHKSKKK
jgi:hypothetical protein